MADISLSRFARALGTNSVLGMARAAGLNPPPPSISVRQLTRLLGLPLQPNDLHLIWDVNPAGQVNHHRPDESNVPLNNLEFEWHDPGEKSLRQVTKWELVVVVTASGKPFSTSGLSSPFSVSLSGFGLGGFAPQMSYSWSVIPFNDIGQGPSSARYTFQTAPTKGPVPAPTKKPSLSVSYSPPPGAAKFHLTGSGFVPNHVVHIRGVNGANVLQPAFGDTNANSMGAIDLEVQIALEAGTG